jgi:hypothetical protein
LAVKIELLGGPVDGLKIDWAGSSRIEFYQIGYCYMMLEEKEVSPTGRRVVYLRHPMEDNKFIYSRSVRKF